MKYLLLLTCLSSFIVVSSCTSPARIIEGRYYDPSGSYSFDAPEGMSTRNMEEKKIDQNMNLVSFQDDFGHLVRFEIAEFPDAFLSSSNKLEDYEKALEIIFENSVLAAIKQQIPNAKVLRKSAEHIDGIGATYFAVIDIPNGSTLIDLNNNQRFNSRRGYLLSFCENYLFVISNQESSIAEFAEKHADVKIDRIKKMHDELVNCRLSCKVTK